MNSNKKETEEKNLGVENAPAVVSKHLYKVRFRDPGHFEYVAAKNIQDAANIVATITDGLDPNKCTVEYAGEAYVV